MEQAKIKKTDSDKRYRRVLAASTLTGDSVKNSAGEGLGKVDEIMIDIPTGRVAYAVLSFGGFLKMGNKLFAVPWDVLAVDEDQKCFILDVDKTRLENAPGFDKDNWPDMADQTWGSQIYSYYGRTPYWEGTTPTRDEAAHTRAAGRL
jgi:sporulation protein YlmC with PRC-barrel domain